MNTHLLFNSSYSNSYVDQTHVHKYSPHTRTRTPDSHTHTPVEKKNNGQGIHQKNKVLSIIIATVLKKITHLHIDTQKSMSVGCLAFEMFISRFTS